MALIDQPLLQVESCRPLFDRITVVRGPSPAVTFLQSNHDGGIVEVWSSRTGGHVGSGEIDFTCLDRLPPGAMFGFDPITDPLANVRTLQNFNLLPARFSCDVRELDGAVIMPAGVDVRIERIHTTVYPRPFPIATSVRRELATCETSPLVIWRLGSSLNTVIGLPASAVVSENGVTQEALLIVQNGVEVPSGQYEIWRESRKRRTVERILPGIVEIAPIAQSRRQG